MVREPIVKKCINMKQDLHINTTIITDVETGELICQNCGTVLLEKITENGKNDRGITNSVTANIGQRPNIAFHDMGLATTIGKSNHDASGNPLGYSMRHMMNRVRLWDARSQTKNSAERNLRKALFEIEKLREKLGLSDAIMERASYLYRKAVKAELIRGRSIRRIVGACTYAACKDMDSTRTITDIANILQENKCLIAKTYKVLFQNLRLITTVPDTTACIIKISNNLHIPEKTKRKAISMYELLRDKKLTAGKKPDAVAAAVIYMASIKTNVNLSQQIISETSGITCVTIRNRCKEFSKYVELAY